MLAIIRLLLLLPVGLLRILWLHIWLLLLLHVMRLLWWHAWLLLHSHLLRWMLLRISVYLLSTGLLVVLLLVVLLLALARPVFFTHSNSTRLKLNLLLACGAVLPLLLFYPSC
jgi:hypothetical protein